MHDIEPLFQDNHLLVVLKPAGLLTQPTDLCADSMETRVKEWLKKQKQKESVFLKPLHRLDKDVSGLVMFALSSKAVSRMNEEMKGHLIKKTYTAEVEGVVKEDSFELKHYLLKGDHKAEVFVRETPGAKLAILRAKVLERKEKTTILEIDLQTGRYHQIRAQLAKSGHPIIGDAKYGSKTQSSRIHLHHGRLEFTHPVTQKLVRIEALYTK